MTFQAPRLDRQRKEVTEAYMEALIPEPSPSNIRKYVFSHSICEYKSTMIFIWHNKVLTSNFYLKHLRVQFSFQYMINLQ